MKKIFSLFLISLFILASVSVVFASVAVKDDGTDVGVATTIDFTGTTDTFDGSTYTVGNNAGSFTTLAVSGSSALHAVTGTTYVGTSSVTFQSTIVGMGYDNSGVETLAADTAEDITAAGVASNLVRKAITTVDEVGTLATGKQGQVLTIYCYSRVSGSWTVTPSSKYGFTSFTLDAAGEGITLLYANSGLGWVVQGTYGGATVNQ